MSNKSKQKGHEAAPEKDRWLAHRDWRIYIGIVLMLVAMFVYLATMDESVRPASPAGQPVPAASGP